MNVHYPMTDRQQPSTVTPMDDGSGGLRDMPGASAVPGLDGTEMPKPQAPSFQFAGAFPASLEAVSGARRQLHQLMCSSGLSGIASDIALGAGELMANAVSHGCRSQESSEVKVTFTCSGGRVRLEVQDPSDERPCKRTAADDEVGGRGLILVEAFSDRWGVEGDPPGGKTVWVEWDIPFGGVQS